MPPAAFAQPPFPAETLLAESPALLLVAGADGLVRYADGCCGLGLRPEQLLGERLAGLVDRRDIAKLASLVVAATARPVAPPRGRIRFVEPVGPATLSIAVRDCDDSSGLPHLLVYGWDLSAEQAELEELREQALHDPLTGLANRLLFYDRLTLELARRRRTGGELGVLYADVDGLKRVNDELGHTAGDLMLVEVARRLGEHLRPADTAARVGGDEFAVICPDVGGPDAMAALLTRLQHSTTGVPLLISGRRVDLRVAMGFAMAEETDQTDHGKALVARADEAMYAAKRERSPRQASG